MGISFHPIHPSREGLCSHNANLPKMGTPGRQGLCGHMYCSPQRGP